jgi:hypothetical protein
LWVKRVDTKGTVQMTAESKWLDDMENQEIRVERGRVAPSWMEDRRDPEPLESVDRDLCMGWPHQ